MKAQNNFTFPFGKFLQSLFNVFLYLTALLGIVHLAAAFSGNEIVQSFRELKTFRPDLMKIRYEVSTRNITDKSTSEQHWEALQSALKLDWAINPEISAWITCLHHDNRMLWTRQLTLFNWPVIASYDWRDNSFYFGPGFWRLTEGEKAAVIAHEYFHHKQNKIWMVGETIQKALTGQLSHYASRIEDEAFLYQWFAYKAMDMPTGAVVQDYFRERNLYRFLED